MKTNYCVRVLYKVNFAECTLRYDQAGDIYILVVLYYGYLYY